MRNRIAFGGMCFITGALLATLISQRSHYWPIAYAQSNAPAEQEIFDAYHRWAYERMDRTWNVSKWLGVPVEKLPSDLWMYQEIFAERKPDVLIEAGTAYGGSAYYFASVFDALKKGRVYTIDIKKSANLPQHSRINYLLGSSTSDQIVQKIKSSIKPGERVMVSLDSDHSKAHVLRELKIYSELVTVGDYLVVEDTNVNGHPVLPTFGPGPWEAVQEFLKSDSRYQPDQSRERYGVTFNPQGYLKRLK